MSEVVITLSRIRHLSGVTLLLVFGLIMVIMYLSRLCDWLQARNK